MSSQMYDLRRDWGAGSVHHNQLGRHSRAITAVRHAMLQLQVQSADRACAARTLGMASTLQQVAVVTGVRQDILAMSISEPSGVGV